MKNQQLIEVLKKVLSEYNDLTKQEEKTIQEFISKAENNSLTSADVIQFASNFFELIKLFKLFKPFLE